MKLFRFQPIFLASLLVLFCAVSTASAQSALDLMAEQRVITYVRQHVAPGEFFLVSDLYKLYKTEFEKRAIDRLYHVFFKIPLFVARYQQDTNRFPTLEEIGRSFELQIPEEVPVLLSIFDADPRAPKFFTRDPESGEITGMDIKAVSSNVTSFGLESLSGGRVKPGRTGQNGPEPTITRHVACEKTSDLALAKILARPLLEAGVDLAGTEYFFNRVDLNGDGKPEVLAYLRGPHTCAGAVCDFFVLSRDGNQYSVVARFDMTWSPVIASEAQTNGWNNLIIWTAPNDGGPDQQVVIAYDGRTYRQAESRILTENASGTAYLSNLHDVGTGIPLPLRLAAYGVPDPETN